MGLGFFTPLFCFEILYLPTSAIWSKLKAAVVFPNRNTPVYVQRGNYLAFLSCSFGCPCATLQWRHLRRWQWTFNKSLVGIFPLQNLGEVLKIHVSDSQLDNCTCLREQMQVVCPPSSTFSVTVIQLLSQSPTMRIYLGVCCRGLIFSSLKWALSQHNHSHLPFMRSVLPCGWMLRWTSRQ